MEERNRSGDVEGRKVQRELQDLEIKEKLHHIKNKILVMSGLVCPYCGKMIDLFKTQGGMFTAKKENLRLLASLPFEPEALRREEALEKQIYIHF